jgi:hypothetical protein
MEATNRGKSMVMATLRMSSSQMTAPAPTSHNRRTCSRRPLQVQSRSSNSARRWTTRCVREDTTTDIYPTADLPTDVSILIEGCTWLFTSLASHKRRASIFRREVEATELCLRASLPRLSPAQLVYLGRRLASCLTLLTPARTLKPA